jgi:uncharacterized protein YqeY
MDMEKRIQSDLVAAMKAKDSVRLASVRSIKTAITVAKTAPGAPSELTDGDIQKIIQKLVKQRKDSAEQYVAAGRQELADNEIAEMNVMEEYLPKQLSEQEIKDIVMRLVVQSDIPCNMGVVMKYFKENYSGQYDGKIVSTVAKTYLS